MNELPPIDAIRCFLAATKTSSFRKASLEVHLSPAAFGQRIKQLEEFVGAPLFERGPRQAITLTPAATALLPKAQSLVENLQAWPTLAREDFVVPRTLTLGTRHELGMSWLLPMLHKLENTVPGLTLNLHFGSGPELLRLLEQKELDAVISSARFATSRFTSLHLHEERYQLVASTALVKAKKIKSWEELSRQQFVDADPTLPLLRYWLDADAMHAKFTPKRVRFLSTIGAIREYAIAHLGVAVLPEYFVQQDLQNKTLSALFSKRRLLSDHFRLVHLHKHKEAKVFDTLASLMRTVPLS